MVAWGKCSRVFWCDTLSLGERFLIFGKIILPSKCRGLLSQRLVSHPTRLGYSVPPLLERQILHWMKIIWTYSYSITNKMHLSLKLFIFVKRSTCLGRFSVNHQEIKTAYAATGMSNSRCYLLLSRTRWNESFISSPIAVGSSGWLTCTCCCIRSFELLMMAGKPSETCRAFYKNK
jgi:hypothetical protein